MQTEETNIYTHGKISHSIMSFFPHWTINSLRPESLSYLSLYLPALNRLSGT